jgi:hypothetical protein
MSASKSHYNGRAGELWQRSHGSQIFTVSLYEKFAEIKGLQSALKD